MKVRKLSYRFKEVLGKPVGISTQRLMFPVIKNHPLLLIA
jgi:hypothetical protein